MISQTDRLILRAFRDDDIPSFIAYRNDSEISKYQGWLKNIDEELAKQFLESQKTIKLGTKEKWLQIAFEEKKSATHIGDCAIRVYNEGRQAEIGITVAKPYQKNGYAFEGLSELFRMAFHRLKVHRIIALVDVDNTASIRLMEKLLMRKEGRFEKSFLDGREWRDEYQFAILFEEWNN